MTIQELAAKYLDMFEISFRHDKNAIDHKGEKYWRVKHEYSNQPDYYDNSPLNKLIYAAHDGMSPDDYKYDYIVTALELISECDDIYDITIEVDIYHHELKKWLSSCGARQQYCDDAMAEYGTYDSIMAIIESGQYRERHEVMQSVISSLELILESEDE
jgi:hypothetical protein